MMRRWLPAFAWDHPVTVLMGLLALLVLGTVAWLRIPLQLFPEGLEPTELFVLVPNFNGSPKETDENIVRPITGQLATIAGISKLRSTADENGARFNVSFEATVDMDEAYNAVVDRIERTLPDLPQDAADYRVFKFDPDDQPIVFLGATWDDSVEDAAFALDRVIKPRIERLRGVASVDVFGVPEFRLDIDYDRERLAAYGVNIASVQQALATDDLQLAGGVLVDRGQERFVRSLSPLDGVDAVAGYPIRPGLRLDDVATVQMVQVGSTDIRRLDGKDTAVIAVRKESGANTVDVSAAVTAALDQLETDPAATGFRFIPFFDQGTLITESLDNLIETALTGGVFAVVILFVFLREWRMTVLIAGAIPASLLVTIGAMYAQGSSLNLLSLMGLMLATGMVVDNAIVVVETIYRRRAEGEAPREAAVAGTAEVGVAIALSTATTMVVFLPLILMTDDANTTLFLGALGFPVVLALAASLVVALFFAPLATRYIGAAQVRGDAPWLAWLALRYERFLGWALAHKADAAVGFLALLLLTGLPLSAVPCAPPGEPGGDERFTIEFTLPPTYAPPEVDEVVRRFESLVDAHREEWGVDVTFADVRGGAREGRLVVFLETDNPLGRDGAVEAARKVLPGDLPGVTAWIGPTGGGGETVTVPIRLYGESIDVLEELAGDVVRVVAEVPGVAEVRATEIGQATDELQLTMNRTVLERYGLSASTVGQTVAFALRGGNLRDLRFGEREVPVAARFEAADRSDLAGVLDTPVANALGTPLPLRAVVDVERAKGPSAIRRLDRRTSVEVLAELEADADLEAVAPRIDAVLARLDLPRGYRFDASQVFADLNEEIGSQVQLLLMSVAFVFLLMGVLFESWLRPLAVLTTLPMAVVGAWWLLWLTGTPFDTMAGIGLVILVGVVVNNGIVLIDRVTQLRGEGWAREAALVEAGRRRLRPILMTALTTISGLVPMALGGAAVVGISYAPLGRMVIGGLAAATFLTLVFLPFLYAWLDDVAATGAAWLRHVLRGTPSPAARAPDSDPHPGTAP